MRKKLLENNNNNQIEYSSRIVHQVILLSIHTSLTGVSTLHLDCIILMILPFSFFGGLMPLLISRGNLFMLRSYDLESLNTLQEGSILCYHLIPELLDVFQLLPLLLLLCNPLSFGLFLCFGLYLSPCFLSHILHMMGLYCLFQMNQEVLLLLMLLLYFLILLFKHVGIILGNIRGGEGRHDVVEEKMKLFFFVYILLT